MTRKLLVLLCILHSTKCIVAQTPRTTTNCIHYHCDNAKTIVPNCATTHTISNKKIADYSQLSGKLSFKLNGTSYTCKENTVHCYTLITNPNCCIDVVVQGIINDSSMVVFRYRVPKRRGVVGNNTPPANFVNLENFYIAINNTPYANYFKTTDINTNFLVNIQCTYKYFGTQQLLNGSFYGTLKDKAGKLINVTDGIFCSNKLTDDLLKD